MGLYFSVLSIHCCSFLCLTAYCMRRGDVQDRLPSQAHPQAMGAFSRASASSTANSSSATSSHLWAEGTKKPSAQEACQADPGNGQTCSLATLRNVSGLSTARHTQQSRPASPELTRHQGNPPHIQNPRLFLVQEVASSSSQYIVLGGMEEGRKER